jgi:DNA repair protein RecO (recombination protein O)
MPRQSEALILRTYPFHEADLLVTFFTRAEGKIRGVAKAAKRSKRRFGGALEPLTHVTAHATLFLRRWRRRSHIHGWWR